MRMSEKCCNSSNNNNNKHNNNSDNPLTSRHTDALKTAAWFQENISSYDFIDDMPIFLDPI